MFLQLNYLNRDLFYKKEMYLKLKPMYSSLKDVNTGVCFRQGGSQMYS